MKFLVISKWGESAYLWLRLKMEGHEVRVFITDPQYRKEILEGLVDKVQAYQPYISWCDACIFDTNELVKEWETVSKTKPCFGGSEFGNMLEKDRKFAHEMMDYIGLKRLESQVFKTVKEAQDHVRKHKVKHVCKPFGGKTGSEDIIISEFDNGEDAIALLHRFESRNIPFDGIEVEEKKDGIECALSAWCAGSLGFIGPIELNFEHKKVANGNIGFLTGEMGCYDEQTEVLTKSGWKFWRDVDKTDELATLVNNELRYEIPKQLVKYSVETEMIGWKNRTIDILVTPNHRMYVQKQTDARKKRDNYYFESASNCVESQYEIKRTCNWIGNDEKFFILPGYSHRQGYGHHQVTSRAISMKIWAEFLGVYIAEGSCCAGQVSIAQSIDRKRELVEQIIKNTGFPYKSYCHSSFTINSVQLARFLKPLGKSFEKRVPRYIKNASTEVIESFLRGYGIGDGHSFKNGAYRTFYTSNPNLAGDIQELLLKIGRSGNIKTRHDRPIGHTSFSKILNRSIITRRLAYEICERKIKKSSWLDSRDKYVQHYIGNVYCAEVSSHVLMVRRNGKAYWCGNTAMTYISKDNKFFKETLAKIENVVKQLDYRGQLDISFIAGKDGFWPLEFTPRLGYPALALNIALQKTPMGELLYGLATKKIKNNDVLNGWCIGVVVVSYGFPFPDEVKKKSTEYPILNVNESNIHHVNLYEAKAGLHDNDVPGLVTSGGMGIPIVIVGTGPTIQDAQKDCYRYLTGKDRVIIPNSYFRTDIGDRVIDKMSEIKSLGIL